MPKINIEKYLNIAKNTKVFRAVEIEVLKELLSDFKDNQNTTYILFEEKKDTDIIGFIIFGKTPMTEFGWDIYWLVVNKDFQRKGIGEKLLKQVENFLLEREEKVILRAETSFKKEYTAAQNFYKKTGFIQVGIIPDFYDKGDGLVTFYKMVDKNKYY